MIRASTIRGYLTGLAICAALLATAAHAGVLLRVEGGLLTGADNVVVGGSTYDVSFQDGSCDSLQVACTQFTFDNPLDASAAALALLDQVFIGMYDTTPNLTRGCTLPGACLVSTIYAPTPLVPGGTNVATATNSSVDAGDNVAIGLIGAAFDTTYIAPVTVAVWSAVAPAQVPEPASLVLALAALFAALGWVRGAKAR